MPDFGQLLIFAFLGWAGWWVLRHLPSNDRAAEPEGAPILLGEGRFDLSVAGTQHHEPTLAAAFASVIREGRKGREDDVDPTDSGDEGEFETCEAAALLRLDDANPHDRNAVQVLLGGALVGYIPAKLAPHFRDMVKRRKLSGPDFRCAARVDVPLSRGGSWDVLLDLPRLKP